MTIAEQMPEEGVENARYSERALPIPIPEAPPEVVDDGATNQLQSCLNKMNAQAGALEAAASELAGCFGDEEAAEMVAQARLMASEMRDTVSKISLELGRGAGRGSKKISPARAAVLVGNLNQTLAVAEHEKHELVSAIHDAAASPENKEKSTFAKMLAKATAPVIVAAKSTVAVGATHAVATASAPHALRQLAAALAPPPVPTWHESLRQTAHEVAQSPRVQAVVQATRQVMADPLGMADMYVLTPIQTHIVAPMADAGKAAWVGTKKAASHVADKAVAMGRCTTQMAEEVGATIADAGKAAVQYVAAIPQQAKIAAKQAMAKAGHWVDEKKEWVAGLWRSGDAPPKVVAKIDKPEAKPANDNLPVHIANRATPPPVGFIDEQMQKALKQAQSLKQAVTAFSLPSLPVLSVTDLVPSATPKIVPIQAVSSRLSGAR